MPQPTLDDYARRLDRLLSDALRAAGRARAQLALDGAAQGEFRDSSSSFRLLEEELFRTQFVEAMEIALTECRRVSERTQLDPSQLLEATRAATLDYLDGLTPVVMPPPDPALARGVDLSGSISEAYGHLRDLHAEVFWEYDHGLYVLPGDQGAAVVINVANVHGSSVDTIQQAGSGAGQGRGST
jgi:hypothetical protein